MTTKASRTDDPVRRRRSLAVLVALLCAAAAPRSALAQGEPSSCPEDAATVSDVSSGATVPFTLTLCPSSGPAALAQLWPAQRSRSRSQRDALVETSGSLRDDRLFRAVSGIAIGSRYPTADRIAALRVLIRYYDPTFAPTDADLLSSTRQSTFRQRNGGGYSPSPIPPTPLSRMAQSPSSPDVAIASDFVPRPTSTFR